MIARIARWCGASAPLALALLAAGCSGGKPGAETPSSQGQPLALDALGTVRATVTASGPGGSQLTVFAGTTVELLASGATPQPPAATARVAVWLADSASSVPVPAGAATAARLRVSLLVDGTEREALFRAPAASGTGPVAGARDAGLELVQPLAAPAPGAIALLYALGPASASRIGSATIDAAATRALGAGLAARAAPAAVPASQAAFNLPGTGEYAVATAGGGTGAASVPPGAYRSSFTVPDPGCIPVGSASACGPARVSRATVIEESTAEILGVCSFDGGDLSTTGRYSPGYEFWCQRAFDAGTGATTITVSSQQANLPWIRASLERASDGLPMLDTYLRPSGGLAVPGGGSVADPYASATWEFAGVKMLTVATAENRDWGWMQQNALQPLLDAGYQARVFRYQATSPGFVAQIDVGETLKGRAALEAGVILKQQGWKVRTGEATRGNRGAYDHAATTYVGTIDEVILQDTTHQKRNDVMHASVVLTPDPSSPTAYLDAAPPTRTSLTGDLTTLLASGTPVMWWLCSGTSTAPGEAWVDIVPALGNYAVMWTGPQSGTKDCQSSYVDSQGVVHTSATTEQMHFLPVMCSGMPLTDPAHLQGSCTVTSPEGRAETLTWDLVRTP